MKINKVFFGLIIFICLIIVSLTVFCNSIDKYSVSEKKIEKLPDNPVDLSKIIVGYENTITSILGT